MTHGPYRLEPLRQRKRGRAKILNRVVIVLLVCLVGAFIIISRRTLPAGNGGNRGATAVTAPTMTPVVPPSATPVHVVLPTITPRPTATSTPIDLSQPYLTGKKGRGETLALRIQPSQLLPIMTTVPAKGQYAITGTSFASQADDSYNGMWYRIAYKGGDAWVRSVDIVPVNLKPNQVPNLTIPVATRTPAPLLLAYEDLARYPQSYKGRSVNIRGKVVQVIEDSGTTCLRLNITESEYGWWDDTVLVCWSGAAVMSHSGARILEDDILRISAIGAGMTTYETVLGAQVTIPLLAASSVIQD